MFRVVASWNHTTPSDASSSAEEEQQGRGLGLIRFLFGWRVSPPPPIFGESFTPYTFFSESDYYRLPCSPAVNCCVQRCESRSWTCSPWGKAFTYSLFKIVRLLLIGLLTCCELLRAEVWKQQLDVQHADARVVNHHEKDPLASALWTENAPAFVLKQTKLEGDSYVRYGRGTYIYIYIYIYIYVYIYI